MIRTSSSFWNHKDYNHDEKKITTFYETVNDDRYRILHDVQFSISDAKMLLDKKNLYSDITLILDIDLTLGEALEMNQLFKNKVDHSEIKRLIDEFKAVLFHNQTCLFVLRPYFTEFIRFVDQNFKEVIIWTNGVQAHADHMVDLVKMITGKKWKGYGRDFSNDYRKIVTSIGLDPLKTWMVDDDLMHFQIYIKDGMIKQVNEGIKFFHIPIFSFTNFGTIEHEKIPLWGKEFEMYDDWFLILIWNWNHMREKNIHMKKFIRNDCIIVY